MMGSSSGGQFGPVPRRAYQLNQADSSEEENQTETGSSPRLLTLTATGAGRPRASQVLVSYTSDSKLLWCSLHHLLSVHRNPTPVL